MEKENEPIAGIVKDGVVIHLDYAPVPECTMFEFTYGEVCIKCNVCGRFKDEPKPTEAEVRARLGCPLQGEEAEGWGYESGNGVHHWYDRLSSVALCGWAGRPDELYSGAFMQEMNLQGEPGDSWGWNLAMILIIACGVLSALALASFSAIIISAVGGWLPNRL